MSVSLSRYEVSCLGSLRRKIDNKLLSNNSLSQGYIVNTLIDDSGREVSKKRHTLIALTFLPNPDSLPVVDHVNRIKTDNRVSNLRWCSYSDNSINRSCLSKPTRQVTCVLPNGDIREWASADEASKEYGVTIQTIRKRIRESVPDKQGSLWRYKKSEILPGEEWRIVRLTGCTEEIGVSSHGRIYRNGNVIESVSSSNSYRYINVKNGDKYRTVAVHRIICAAFHGMSDKDHIVNHKDGNKRNNHMSNLEWVSRSENTLHAYNTGLFSTHNNIVQMDDDGQTIAIHVSAIQAAKQISGHDSKIIMCCMDKRNKTGGFKWRYATDDD